MKELLIHISSYEDELIQLSEDKYADYYIYSNRCLNLLMDFIDNISDEGQVFLLFLSQFQNSMCLSFLSTLRRHEIQAMMILRYALESSVLASYALYTTNINDFIKIDELGYAHEIRAVKNKANKWLEKNYPIHNEKIKKNKDLINDFSTHANIIPTFGNIDFSLFPEASVSFFDNEDELLIKQKLWWIGNIIVCLLDLYAEISKVTKIFNLKSNFYNEMKDLSILNNRLLNELQQNERFKRHEGIRLERV